MAWKEAIAKVMSAHPKGKPLNKNGSELPDPVPMDPPIGYKKQPSMFEVVRDMIRRERLEAMGMNDVETPEEADDFVVDDDYDPSSPYEHNFDNVADAAELKRLRDALDVRERELGVQSGQLSSSSSSSSSGAGGGAATGGGSPAPAPPVAVPPSAGSGT